MNRKFPITTNRLGFLFAALATLIWSGNFLVARGLNSEIEPIPLAFWRWSVAAALVFPLTTDRIPLSSYQPITIAGVLYIGIFASVVAYFLWNRSVDLIGPTQASMIYYLIPLFSGILAFLFLDEKVSLIHFFSGVLILSGIWMATKQSTLP